MFPLSQVTPPLEDLFPYSGEVTQTIWEFDEQSKWSEDLCPASAEEEMQTTCQLVQAIPPTKPQSISEYFIAKMHENRADVAIFFTRKKHRKSQNENKKKGTPKSCVTLRAKHKVGKNRHVFIAASDKVKGVVVQLTPLTPGATTNFLISKTEASDSGRTALRLDLSANENQFHLLSLSSLKGKRDPKQEHQLTFAFQFKDSPTAVRKVFRDLFWAGHKHETQKKQTEFYNKKNNGAFLFQSGKSFRWRTLEL